MAGKHDHMKFGVNDTFNTLNLRAHFKLVLKQCATNSYKSLFVPIAVTCWHYWYSCYVLKYHRCKFNDVESLAFKRCFINKSEICYI